jgi:predicted secreted Zn-dependent protease
MHVLLRGLMFSVVIVVIVSSPIEASPTVTEENVYYNVRGTSAAELRTQLNKFGVKGGDGRTYRGNTNWNVSWRYVPRSNSTNCWITSVNTTVRIKFTFPKWIDRSNAPEELRQKWDNYIVALIKHERRHRDIAVEAAVQIERAIAGMKPRPTCGGLKRDVDAVGHRLIEDCRKRQSDYDDRTNHGHLEGARFP